MSSVVIAGNTSGSVTLSAPDVAGTTTLTLPSTSGTVLTTASGQWITTGSNIYYNTGNVGIGTASPSSDAIVKFINISDATSSGIVLTAPRKFSIYSSGSSTLVFRDETAAATRVSLDSSGNLSFNSGYGSAATAYGCRAWVNFNGTGTVAIRGSGNVSSITDNGTGDYTINFTTAMPDTNYSVCGAGKLGTTQTNPHFGLGGTSQTVFSVNAVQVVTLQATTNTDLPYVFAAIFR